MPGSIPPWFHFAIVWIILAIHNHPQVGHLKQPLVDWLSTNYWSFLWFGIVLLTLQLFDSSSYEVDQMDKISLVLQIPSEKVFTPKKNTPNTVSEGVWSCRVYVLPSGNLLHSYWKWHIEIVDLPSKNCNFTVRYVSLPLVGDLSRPSSGGLSRGTSS